MRKYHRWLSVVFGVFLLWIAATGIASHVAALIANGGFEHEEPAAQAAAPTAAASAEASGALATPAARAPFVCPEDMTCRPKAPGGARAWVGFFHHLHSGEEFGPLGTVLSILSGATLLFFAFSGLWMYVAMARGRKRRDPKAGLFWE